MEPSKLYRAFRQEVPEEDYTIPIGKAKVVKPGSDLTVVSWGAYLHEALKAAELLQAEGIDAEVIDLRTISPLDRETILESVKKTGRFAVVHEAAKSFGPGAELVALVNEGAFLYLEAPPCAWRALTLPFPCPGANTTTSWMPSAWPPVCARWQTFKGEEGQPCWNSDSRISGRDYRRCDS